MQADEWLAKPREVECHSRQQPGALCRLIAQRRDNRLYTVNTRHKANLNDLDQVKDFARRLGGEYLSGYMPKDLDEKVQWRCKQGHIWFIISPGYNTRILVPRMCRKKRYDLSTTRYFFGTPPKGRRKPERAPHFCAKYRIRQRTPGVGVFVRASMALICRIVTSQRRWCPTCEFGMARSIQFPTFNQELKQYAKAMGGECLAQSYTGMREPIEWACAKGHHWDDNRSVRSF